MWTITGLLLIYGIASLAQRAAAAPNPEGRFWSKWWFGLGAVFMIGTVACSILAQLIW
jgi:hypothetical protein